MIDRLEHSIIIIQDGQVEYTNDRFLHQFQEAINRYGQNMRDNQLYESITNEIKINQTLSCCRCFKKTKKKESDSKKEDNDFLDLKLFEQVDLNQPNENGILDKTVV